MSHNPPGNSSQSSLHISSQTPHSLGHQCIERPAAVVAEAVVVAVGMAVVMD
jgi:hypothetical protein